MCALPCAGSCRVCGMTPMTAGVCDGQRVGGFEAGGQAHIGRGGGSTVADGAECPEAARAQFPLRRGAGSGGYRRGARGARLFLPPALVLVLSLASHARGQARGGTRVTRLDASGTTLLDGLRAVGGRPGRRGECGSGQKGAVSGETARAGCVDPAEAGKPVGRFPGNLVAERGHAQLPK
ncbi:protein of unknown function [Burkholderia multivorans]